jgi:nucleoside-diphosphate-sugar epimerase
MADKLIVGCGYLGRRVAARWLAQGHRVFGTTRSEGRAAELRQLGVEPVLCDVLDRSSLENLPNVLDVLYCVSITRNPGRSMKSVYVEGLDSFLTWFLTQRSDALHITYVSSTSVYGQVGGELVDESAITSVAEEPGSILVETEERLRNSFSTMTGSFRILRFAGIYGPGRLIRRQAIESGEPIVGDADKWLNLIQVEDGAAAVVAACERGQSSAVYNVCDDHPVRRRDFYREMTRLLNAPEPRFVAPEPGAPLPPHERANRRIVNRRMREELGVTLRYPSYVEGLRASID